MYGEGVREKFLLSNRIRQNSCPSLSPSRSETGNPNSVDYRSPTRHKKKGKAKSKLQKGDASPISRAQIIPAMIKKISAAGGQEEGGEKGGGSRDSDSGSGSDFDIEKKKLRAGRRTWWAALQLISWVVAFSYIGSLALSLWSGAPQSEGDFCNEYENDNAGTAMLGGTQDVCVEEEEDRVRKKLRGCGQYRWLSEGYRACNRERTKRVYSNQRLSKGELLKEDAPLHAASAAACCCCSLSLSLFRRPSLTPPSPSSLLQLLRRARHSLQI